MNITVDKTAPVHLVRGDDPTVIADATRTLLAELVGDGDRLMIEECSTKTYEYTTDDGVFYSPKIMLSKMDTGSLFGDPRIVVGREMSQFSTAETVKPLVDFLKGPRSSNTLVLVWNSPSDTTKKPGLPPKSLLEAINAAGGAIIDTKIGSGRDQSNWINEQLAKAPVRLDGPAKQFIVNRIGEDATRLIGLLPTLESVFGPGAKLTVEDITPYVGDAGSVKPWDLTDAIDRAQVTLALDTLHRMTDNGMHQLQVMALLTNHVIRMVTLDGSGVTSEAEAAKLLGAAPFMAKKAISQGRKLGSSRLREFMQLLAKADLDLRGATALPPETVMDILVARLASRSR